MASNYSFTTFGPAVTANPSIAGDRNPSLNRIRTVVTTPGFRVFKELLDTLIGAAAGDTASATHKEVGYSDPGRSPLLDRGGKIAVSTVTDINRASTAGDVTALKSFLVNVSSAPSSYPTNRNGLNQKQF
jgi:hypothetical protein